MGACLLGASPDPRFPPAAPPSALTSHALPPPCSPPQVLMVDVERGAIVVKGSVPGKPGNVVEIAPAKKLGKNIN